MPDWNSEVRRRLAHLPLRAERNAEIVEELSQHLEDCYADLVAHGASAESARTQALTELEDGGMLAAALHGVERSVDPNPIAAGAEHGAGPLANLAQDVRYALRGLGQRPVFSAIAILTLALGIGANTTLFGVVNAILLRPLPFPHPEQLITFFGTAPEKGLPEVNLPEGLFLAYKERVHTMQSLAAFTGGGITLTGFGDPQRLDIGAVSPDFFTVLGARPLLGRTMVEDDASSDTATVTVISHALWQRQFGGDPSVVGRSMTLGNFPYQVIGVMPPGFDYPNHAQLWVPLRLHPTVFNCWCLETVARLKPGQTAQTARAEVEHVTNEFAPTRPDVFPNYTGGARAVAMSLLERTVGEVRRPLIVVLAAGGLVLLIACANIANLLLARASTRERELAVRCCLGASRSRIASQLLTESLLLSISGAAGGVLLSIWGIGALRRLPADQFPRIDELSVDLRVLGFGIALALVTGVLFGLAPALRSSRVELQHALKEGSRGSAGVASRRLSNAFVVAQFAVSLVLLVGAGLTLKSFRNLTALNPGYRVENVLLARVPVPYPRYASDTAVRIFYGQLLEQVSAIPGVRAVGIANRVPLSPGNPQDNVVAEGKEPRQGEPVLVANIRNVTPKYFDAIGTPLLEGRAFTDADAVDAPRVAIVDRSFADHFWPGEDPIGKRFRHGGDTTAGRWVTVIGIVPNVKHSALDEPPSLQVYEHFGQRTSWNDFLVVRSELPTEGLVRALRAQVAALDPLIPIYDVGTMEESLNRTLSTRRITDALLLGFALAALVLAAIGIYGVISLNVNARGREFGVRLALGAQARDLLAMVLRQGAVLAGLGVAIGMLGALWLTSFIEGLLFGVPRLDLPTFLGVAGVLTAVSLIACLGPAWRATRSDVIRVLKAE